MQLEAQQPKQLTNELPVERQNLLPCMHLQLLLQGREAVLECRLHRRRKLPVVCAHIGQQRTQPCPPGPLGSGSHAGLQIDVRVVIIKPTFEYEMCPCWPAALQTTLTGPAVQ